MMHERRWLTVLSVLAVLAVVTASLSGVAVAQPDNSTSADYSLQELRQDGKHYSVDGARIVPSEERIYWLEHTPANQPWRQVTKENNGPKFGSGQTLKTNRLYLRSIRAQTDTESLTVTVVSWERGTRTVTSGNTTTEKPVATNVTVQEQQVSLGSGWALGEIKLPRHDETKRVTMWVNGHEDTARWTFNHRSVATSQPIDVNSWSGFIMLAGGFVIIPALGFGAYGGRKVKTWIDKVGEPPGHGFAYYLAVTTIGTGAIVFGAYYYAAEVIVTIPIVLGLYVAVVYTGYMLATHEGRAERKLFWQPHIESVEAFTSTKIPSVGAGEGEFSFSEDMPFGKMQTFNILDEGQNGLSIVRPGWMAFLARLKGGRARIENADELKTRFRLWESAWNECFIVDPEADQLADYKPPGLRLKTPEIDSWKDLVWPVGLLGGGSLLAWRAAELYGPTAWVILTVAVPVLVWKFAVEGTDSHVHIDPAPAALRPVLASMLVVSIGNRKAHRLDEAESFAWKALAAQEDVKVDQLRRGTETTVHQAFGSTAGDDGPHGGDDAATETAESDVVENVGDIDADAMRDNGAPSANESAEGDDGDE